MPKAGSRSRRLGDPAKRVSPRKDEKPGITVYVEKGGKLVDEVTVDTAKAVSDFIVSTVEKHEPRVFDRSIPGAKDLYEWDAIMRVARPMAEESVRHELRSLGGKRRAKGYMGDVKRAVRAEFQSLIAKGTSPAAAVAALTRKYELTKSTIRKHVADLR